MLNLIQGFRSSRQTQSNHHFTLQTGQWLEIPTTASHLRVLSGKAWIVVGKRDVVLSSGQGQPLSADRYPIAVFGLGSAPVEVEVSSKDQPQLVY